MLPYYRLAYAVKHGCIDDMRDALAHGAPLKRPDATSLSLLQLAQKSGQLDAARLLLQFGADPRAEIFPNGDSLINAAIRQHQIAFASLWLENGVDPNLSNDRGIAPIHLAARYDEQYLLEQLLEAGASMSQADHKGRTAIVYAAEAGNSVVATRLANLGANPLAVDGSDTNAFPLAAANNHAACCYGMFTSTQFRIGEREVLLASLSRTTRRFGFEDVMDWMKSEHNEHKKVRFFSGDNSLPGMNR